MAINNLIQVLFDDFIRQAEIQAMIHVDPKYWPKGNGTD